MTPREPLWLTKKDVLAVHEQLLHAHGGSSGVRDEGLLESALARPTSSHTAKRICTRFATAYAEGLTRNHPFVDGNKRSAFMAAYVFLGANGLNLRADETDVVRMMVGLSDRSVLAANFAAWLRANSTATARPSRAKAVPKKRSRRSRRGRS